MEWPHIERLVEKYWAGETTLTEEAELRQALGRTDVPPALRREAELMGFWQAERTIGLRPEAEETLQRVHLTEEATPETARPTPHRTLSPIWWRVAATLVIGAGLYLMNLQSRQPEDPLGALLSLQEDVEAEETYDEVRDALLFISLKFKRGAEPMQNLQELNHARQPMEQLKNFNRAEEIIRQRNDRLND